MLLEAPQRVRERPISLGVDRGGEVRHLPQSSNADTQTMQTIHRRAIEGPAMGVGHALPLPGFLLREHPANASLTNRTGSGSNRLAHMVEQKCLAFRAEEGAQKFAAGAGIVPEARSIAVEPVEFLARSDVVRYLVEKTERNIAVAHLSDEPGQAADTTVQGPERIAVDRAEKLVPNAEAGPQPAHVPVQAM